MADKTDGELFEELWNDKPAEPPSNEAAPAPEPVAPTPADPAPEPPQENTGDTDWLAALPEAARQQVEAERQQLQQVQAQLLQEQQQRAAIQGRLTPMQRRVQELERLQRPAPADPAPAPAPDSYFDSEEWKTFQRDYPDEARTQRALVATELAARDREIAALRARQQDNDTRQQRLDEALDRLRLSEARAQLAEQHPDWMQINAREDFHQWLDDFRHSQPEAVLPVYLDDERFRQMLTEPVFVGRLLTQFKREHTAAPPPAAVPAPVATPNHKLDLAAAPDTRQQAPMRRSSAEAITDPGELFAYYWNQPG